tara:strand:- start:6757 stop:7161 length:405 start_codon:yes stop_codon:yes gene_type:complete
MKKNDWVSASDVGRAAFCPRYLNHKHDGADVSGYAMDARKKGDIEHDRLNKQAEDKRCYVASYAYGVDDPRTILLRQFRDKHLVGNLLGRSLIGLYYRTSPALIDGAKRFKPLDHLLRRVVDKIVVWLGVKNDE